MFLSFVSVSNVVWDILNNKNGLEEKKIRKNKENELYTAPEKRRTGSDWNGEKDKVQF